MQLINMKTEGEGYESPEPNPYGYGLRIHLTDDQCELLGIGKAPEAGTKLKLVAAAFVARSTESTDDGEDSSPDKDVCLEIQITDMAVEMAGNTAAQSLYSASNMNP